MKLYVGNLSFQTSEEELRQLFSAHGNVVEVSMIMDRETQRPRGFAFVTMSNAQEGQKAIEAIDGASVGGRNLTVNEARPMESRGPRNFSGGGSGGGGGSRGGGGGGYRR